MRMSRSLLMILSLAACKTEGGSGPKDAVAKVDSTTITKAEFDLEVERTLARFKGPNGQVPAQLEGRIKDSTLKRLIDEALIRNKAKSLSLTVTPEELAAKFTEHKNRFGSEQQFKEFLDRSKSTEEQVKQSLEMQMVRERVLEKLATPPEVTDAELETYYNEKKATYNEQEQVRARHVLAKIETPPPPSASGPAPKPEEAKKALEAAKKKAKTKIEAAQKKLKSGAKFEDVAKEFSDDVTKAQGGDLGYFSKGRMVPPFEEAAFKMKVGETSGIVETAFGFHIIKVEDHKAARERPFSEVKESIKASLNARKRSELRREVLANLKKDAKIEEFVKFDQPAVPPPGGAAPGASGAALPKPGAPGANPTIGQPPPAPTPATPPAGDQAHAPH